MHDEITVMAGDDWEIDAVLEDTDGTPIDLEEATLQWTLITPEGRWSAVSTAATVMVNDPPSSGAIRIIVPRTATNLPLGRYHDSLRVVFFDDYDTYWTGAVLVDFNLFSQIPNTELIADPLTITPETV